MFFTGDLKAQPVNLSLWFQIWFFKFGFKIVFPGFSNLVLFFQNMSNLCSQDFTFQWKMVDIGLNAFVLVFWAQMSSEPCVGFPRISSGNQFLRRKTNSYVGFRRIFFCCFFRSFLFFLSFYGIFQKGFGFFVCFCCFFVCGGEGRYNFVFFIFFGFAPLIGFGFEQWFFWFFVFWLWFFNFGFWS